MANVFYVILIFYKTLKNRPSCTFVTTQCSGGAICRVFWKSEEDAGISRTSAEQPTVQANTSEQTRNLNMHSRKNAHPCCKDSITHRPARSHSLYRLSYPVHDNSRWNTECARKVHGRYLATLECRGRKKELNCVVKTLHLLQQTRRSRYQPFTFDGHTKWPRDPRMDSSSSRVATEERFLKPFELSRYIEAPTGGNPTPIKK